MTLEIQAMNYKDILTGINTKEIVDALTLITNKEKHSIEVCQGRRQKNKALLDIVWKKPSVYKEFIEAISQSSPDSTLANSIHEVTGMKTIYKINKSGFDILKGDLLRDIFILSNDSLFNH